ncbi:MAG: peptide ABC transporter substrate-binding protein [Chloroflexota bacterium]
MSGSSREAMQLTSRAVTRRGVLAAGGVGAMVLLAACSSAPTPAPTTAPAATSAPAAATSAPAATAPTPTVQPVVINTAAAATAMPIASAAGAVNAWGRTLPSDAAPPAQQVTISYNDSEGANYKAEDFYETVYAEGPDPDLFDVPLTRIDRDFNIHPGHATRWDVSKDGLTWTFTLKPGYKWSDGNDVTANDWVQTFRYSADPKHAWDFTWYWSGVIKNYTEATKGTVPTSQIGVRQGEDIQTLIFETEAPVPYMPAQLLYSWPLSAAGLAKYESGVYNTNPSTSISFGPYKLQEWSPDKRVVVVPNPIYKGDLVPYIEQVIGNIYKGGSQFLRFQAGEIDSCEVFAPDIKAAQQDPKLKDFHLYVNPQSFRVYYTFFDVTAKPWSDIRVRQAFAHAVDRDAIIKGILAPLALPAYGALMPGFPSSIQDPLKPFSNYDPARAKQLLAEAGYPNGKGFPAVTFYVRGGGPPTDPAVTQALAAGWKQTLGIQVNLQNLDSPSFMTKLNNKPTQIPFGWISYGMDYFDASDLLGVWKGGGRHDWNNKQYDGLLAKAGPELNQDTRNSLYAQAQKLLTGDAQSIFVYFQLHGYYYQPFFKGSALDKDKYGYDGLEWPGFSTATDNLPNLYIANNVDLYRHAAPA